MISSNILIQRSRLTKFVEKLPDCRILYVQAPAGYGKTVFAGQWMDSRKEPNAVITLDEYDNTAADICYKLKNLLEDLYIEEAVTAFTKHPEFNKAPAEFLMRAVTVMPKDFRASIVIDDLHYLTDLSAQKVLKDFFMRLPKGIKICILSRGALPEAFSGLVLKNDVQFISQEQLLFDNREIYALYKSKNITITKKQAEEVLMFTEGWPMGIQALENMSQNWLESFLKTQVWEMWDKDSREFMVETCMEDELSDSLCNALTGKNDSGAMLEQLVENGAFITKQRGGSYRFHRIFRGFLRKLIMARSEEYRKGHIQTAGQWYLKQNDFYHAVERFFYIKDYEQVAGCFDLLGKIDRTGFDAEQVMRAVHDTLDEEILAQYPHLYFMMAFTARNEGRNEEFKEYADLYYKNHPQIVKRSPELAHNIFFLYAMDFRITFKDILEIAANTRAFGTFQGVRGMPALYFPLYHKSYKDFSELLPGDIDAGAERLIQTLGSLLGEECNMLRECIRGGLYYEQGNLQRAQELSLLALAELQDSFVPESKFCAMILLLTVTHAMQQPEQEELVQRDIQNMIEKDKAFYLQYNFDAVICRNRLDFGDTAAAQRWLENRGAEVYDHLEFYKLYGYFTTARAHIALGNFNHSIILLEKLLEMCKVLRRTIDVIEAEILLAISFWKKKRSNHKKALDYLEEAVRMAQQLEYKQAFINDGAELKNLLSSLKNWTMRSDYSGNLSGTFVKKLYIGAVEQGKYSSGLTGDKIAGEQNIKFTQQQKRVAKLMCEGYSYRKIAEELGIRFSTVRSHIELIYRKLNVSGMDEAILKIRQFHLLEEDYCATD